MPDAAAAEDPWLEHFRTEGVTALAAFHAGHYARLERLIRFRMAPLLAARLDPADVLQDAYLEAQRRLPDYLAAPTLPPFVWLRQIAVQVALAAYRRHVGARMRSAGREVPLDDGSPDGEEWLRDHALTPERAVILAEVRKRVSALLDGMDDIDREVLALRHFEGLTNDETAAALGLRKSAASNRYVRALGRFREFVQPPDDDADET